MKILGLLIVLLSFSAVAFSQKIGKYQTVSIESSADLQKIIDSAVTQTIANFADKELKAENLAVTLIDLRNPNQLKSANFRGEEKFFPASIVKMYYQVALQQWLETGKIKLSPEIERANRDMIVDSSNEATQFILDVLTDTSSGTELAPKELEKWGFKRNIVNRYFASLGYKNINVNQKTFCEGAYGREKQFRGKDSINGNKLTTNATAQLLAEIILNKAVSPIRSVQMIELLKRDWEGTNSKMFDGEDQAKNFSGQALKELNLSGAKLWSKAGWTSTARHDVAYIETPNGLKFVICVFTTNFASEKTIIPSLAKAILQESGATK